MTRILAQLFAALALGLAIAGSVVAFLGVMRERPALTRLARVGAVAMFACVAAVFVLMEYALITHDFSISYVAQVGSRQTPLFYTIASLWSALEGSILLWALILTGFTALLAWRSGPGRPEHAGPYALGPLLAVNVFFLMLIVGPANPFRLVSPVPADGPGPNPLPQNHPFMAVHPPLLYTGYVGMAVPFSIAMAALVLGRFDRAWSRTIRRWTLVPWTFLTLGIVAGAWWSYEVLGWGGYWAWDPVENASFLPWLTATAFLHSVMVQERRGMLKLWTLTLIIATFLLTLLGTFLTRSGVIASVHAFSEGLIGPFFLGFLALVMLLALVLLGWRGERLRTEGRLDSPLSRETAFLVNNLLFAAFTFVVLLGTLYPLVAEAMRGEKVTVGAPFFNQMTTPVALALVFLTGVGPALPWGRGSLPVLRDKFAWPTAAALVAGVVLFALGVHALLPLATFMLAVLAGGLLIGEFATPARVRRASMGESWLRALRGVAVSNRRRYGGYIVHAGVILVAVGIAASGSYKREGEWTLRPGEAAQFGRYSVRFDSIWAVQEPHRDGVIAAASVFANDDFLQRMTPRLNYYRTSMEPIGSPAVREGVREDVYLVLMAYAEDGSHATLKAIVSPLVTWIWLGGLVIGVGALFAQWPTGRRAPQPAEARQPAKQPVGKPRKRPTPAPTTGRA